MQPRIEHIQKKLGHLPVERLTEVEDFIDFLQLKDQEKYLHQGYAQAADEAFSKVWDNDNDAIYDTL